LSIHSLHNSSPCCSAASLLLKIGPSMRLTSTIELSRPGRKTIPCEYQSNRVAKVGFAVPVIRKPLYRSIPHCFTINDTTENTFRCQLRTTSHRDSPQKIIPFLVTPTVLEPATCAWVFPALTSIATANHSAPAVT
jgi:hypothetical protein